MATAKFELYRSGTKYRWRLKTSHHEVAAFGEGQPTKDSAIRDIEAVKKMIADAKIDDTTGEP
jgi:uncharacterized protein YegP (UPF0339 family)